MTKHDKEAEAKVAEEKINDPQRPEQNDTKPLDPEVVSHNWQPNSPAHDLSYPGVSANAVNTVAEAEKAEEKAKEHKPEEISQEEFDRRTKLDVTNREFINPSLDHYKVKK